MFGAIPAEWLLELARDTGIMIQMDLDIPRHYIIDEEFLTDVHVAYYHLNGKGQKTGTGHSVDHPAFAALRNHLEATDRIKTSRNSSNGDVALKPFYLNDIFFDVGDRFPCAAAQGNSLRVRQNRLNKNNETVTRESNEKERTI